LRNWLGCWVARATQRADTPRCFWNRPMIF